MNLVLLCIAVMIIFSISGLIHYNGYKVGYKHGFDLGKEKINEYALKVNEAQDERIKELESQRYGEINKIARFLTKDIEK